MLLLLQLILSFQYANAVTIHQIPAFSGRPGEAVVLECTIEGSSSGSDDTLLWYRQYRGNGPQALFTSSMAKYVQPPDGVDGFTAERPKSNKFYLKSSGLQANSSAVYFCAWKYHGASERRRRRTKTSQCFNFTGTREELITCLDDCRPAGRTSIGMKRFEGLVMKYMNDLSPLQLVCPWTRSTADVILLAPPSTLEHLDRADAHVKMRFSR
ncbi:uncharacterized protein [Mobula birostris]|uniref:uncharacterized protein n=1 Tax=Mobula birostris TaxID=1983395 RepID=UPI003B28DB87